MTSSQNRPPRRSGHSQSQESLEYEAYLQSQRERVAMENEVYQEEPVYEDYDSEFEDEYPRRGIALSSWITLVVLIVVLVVSGLAVKKFIDGSKADLIPAGQVVEVVIPEDKGLVQVGSILSNAGLVDSSLSFTTEARQDERSSAIQPGTYQLAGGMSTAEILDIITEKRDSVEIVTWNATIPEGLSAGQIMHKLATSEGSPYTLEEFQAAAQNLTLPAWVPTDLPEGAQRLEGLLWPNTYNFYEDSTPEQILQQLVDETAKQVDSLALGEGQNPYEILIIASLIERETAVEAERPVISGVIRNRLNRPMRLQIDASVVYAIALQTGERPTRLLNKDYDFQSPWSTYTNDGLPPTPISNVSITALTAAKEPQENPYYYYALNDLSAGTHAFAETLEQHNANVAHLRQLLAERDAQKAAEAAASENSGQ